MTTNKNNTLLSKVIYEIDEKTSESEAEKYITISVRPSPKAMSMLNTLAHLGKKPPSFIVNNGLSTVLYEFAASISLESDVILDAYKEVITNNVAIHRESALAMLITNGILNVKAQNNI